MSKNKLIIAAAGSGKTTYLINEALKIKKSEVLITTFTEANEEEIRKKFINRNGYIPNNITIQTWFSFILQHGVKPYQGGVFEKKVNGLTLISGKSKKFTPESNTEKHYFDDGHKIYSDKISKFVLKCNRSSNGEVINRLTRIYPIIFIDEVQDLACWDLDILKIFFDSQSHVLLVGDFRQGTYSTHDAQKNKQFKKSQIIYFFDGEDIESKCEIDNTSLTINYRSNQKICDFSNKLFPDYEQTVSGQIITANHDVVILVKEDDIDDYLQKYPDCVQLRDSIREKRIKTDYDVMNFGNSKGLEFDRVLIYPTKSIMKWIKNNNSELPQTSRCKFYVAITRAKYSVGIVYDYCDDDVFEGIEKYISNNEE